MQGPDIRQLAALIPAQDPVVQRIGEKAQVFLVGGAVRDGLLGQEISDKDFVVVGSTVEAMSAAGFVAVGKDFPVFLHPATHDEYALARTERKSGKGYKGFVFNASPEVTLHEDLSRRDLTMNAMAVSAEGELIDPFNGAQDLRDKIFRHVGAAFSEDPVRLLRLARFCSRLPEFQIAQETLEICRKIVDDGETSALVAERVWQELSKGLSEARPSRMVQALLDCHAWSSVTQASRPPRATTLAALDQSAAQMAGIDIRAGILLADNADISGTLLRAPKTAQEMSQAIRVSQKFMPLVSEALAKGQATDQQAKLILEWLEAADALRRPDRFADILLALRCLSAATDQLARTGQRLVDELLTPNAQQRIARSAQNAQNAREDISQAVRDERLKILQSALSQLR